MKSEQSQRQNTGKLHFRDWGIVSKGTSGAAAANRDLSLKIKLTCCLLVSVSAAKDEYSYFLRVNMIAQKNGASGRSPKTP